MATERSEGGRAVSPTTHHVRGRAREAAGARLVDRLTAQLREVEHGNMRAADHTGTCVIGGDPIRYGEAIARQWGSGNWSHVNCVLLVAAPMWAAGKERR